MTPSISIAEIMVGTHANRALEIGPASSGLLARKKYSPNKECQYRVRRVEHQGAFSKYRIPRLELPSTTKVGPGIEQSGKQVKVLAAERPNDALRRVLESLPPLTSSLCSAIRSRQRVSSCPPSNRPALRKGALPGRPASRGRRVRWSPGDVRGPTQSRSVRSRAGALIRGASTLEQMLLDRGSEELLNLPYAAAVRVLVMIINRVPHELQVSRSYEFG